MENLIKLHKFFKLKTPQSRPHFNISLRKKGKLRENVVKIGEKSPYQKIPFHRIHGTFFSNVSTLKHILNIRNGDHTMVVQTTYTNKQTQTHLKSHGNIFNVFAIPIHAHKSYCGIAGEISLLIQ